MTSDQKTAMKVGLGIFVGCFLLLFLLIWIADCEDRRPEREQTEYIEKANEALNQGDFSTAYGIVDQMIAKGLDAGYNLNRTILTNEIAENIENANAARIIICIKERAKFNSKNPKKRVKNEVEMLEHAMQLAEVVGDSETADKLRNAWYSWETDDESLDTDDESLEIDDDFLNIDDESWDIE